MNKTMSNDNTAKTNIQLENNKDEQRINEMFFCKAICKSFQFRTSVAYT